MTQISKTGFNVLSGFIEIYPPDTTFGDHLPWKVLTEQNDEGNNVTDALRNTRASNTPIIERLDLLNSVKINESFKTLTDTCEVVVPRFDQWILKDSKNINNYALYYANGEDFEAVFAKGNVVRVFLGYDGENKLMFNGYIAEASTNAPITIKLEDAMWRLKRKTINKVYRPTGGRKEVRLEDFIHEVLDGTGVELDESVLTKDVFFGNKVTFRNSTVARVMDDIKKRGLSVYIRLGKLVIGRTYFDATLTPHLSTKSNPDYEPPILSTEWDVPKGGSNLKVTTMDKKTKMVTVQRFIGNDRVIQLNVALDPNKIEDTLVPAQISDSINKDSQENKDKLDRWLSTKYKVKIDTTGYSQHTATMDSIKYKSRTFTNTDSDFEELIEEMFEYGKDMYFKYFDNGLGGSVTIFGDYGLFSAQSIDIYDPVNPEFWGEYLVTSVATTWGFGGYRQTLTIGIKIKDSTLLRTLSIDVTNTSSGVITNSDLENRNLA